MLIIDPSECCYGEASSLIADILYRCDFDWNVLLQQPSKPQELRDGLGEHFKRLEQLAGVACLQTASIVVVGDWEEGAMLRHSLVMGAGVPRWRSALSHISTEAKFAIRNSKRLFNFIKPPIWTVPGIIDIVNPLLADHAFLPKGVSESEHKLLWEFMCDLEQFAHDAILYAIANCEAQGANPFLSVIDMYRTRSFPIEFCDGQFFVFEPPPMPWLDSLAIRPTRSPQSPGPRP